MSKKAHREKTNRISKINFSGDLDLKPDAELETTEFCVPLKMLGYDIQKLLNNAVKL